MRRPKWHWIGHTLIKDKFQQNYGAQPGWSLHPFLLLDKTRKVANLILLQNTELSSGNVCRIISGHSGKGETMPDIGLHQYGSRISVKVLFERQTLQWTGLNGGGENSFYGYVLQWNWTPQDCRQNSRNRQWRRLSLVHRGLQGLLLFWSRWVKRNLGTTHES